MFLAVQKAKAGNKAAPFFDLFTANGIDKAAPTAQSPGQLIYKLTLNPVALSRIRQAKQSLLQLSIPTRQGPLEIELVATQIFASGFTVKTSVPDSTFRFDINQTHYYQGVVKNNPNSIVAVAISHNDITGMIADSTGNRVLAHKRDKSAATTDYAIYNEKAVTTETRPFTCGTVDSGSAVTVAMGSSTVGNKANSTCEKYIGVYLEADYSLYQHYANNGNSLTIDVLSIFGQVATIYQNESVKVQVSGLTIWNVSDPYSATTDSGVLGQFQGRWNGLGNTFPGQIAHLLAHRYLGGGIAFVDVLDNRSLAYSLTSDVTPSRSLSSPYPAYSQDVLVIAHEIGHNFGSRHTHWCGWPGGAIDNCNLLATSPIQNESDNYGNTCSPGPTPVNGGTIMSYCHIPSGIGINFTKGFGPLPGNLIRGRIDSVSLPTTTADGSVQSIVSGSWTANGIWVCGQVPSLIHDVTISTGTAVQLNTNGEVKSLNINGVLDISANNSTINIKNN